MTVFTETMNERRVGLRDIAKGIGEKLGLGPSEVERVEQGVIPEIFALAGNGTADGISAISSTRKIEISRSSGNFTIASMRNLDLRGVLPDFQLEQGETPTLEEIVAALEKSSGRLAVQKAQRESRQMRGSLGAQDFYTFTVSVKGKPQNVLYTTRRGFVKGLGAVTGGLLLTACTDALRRMTLTPSPTGPLPPPGATLNPPDATPNATPEAFRTVSIQDVVPAFSEARQLQIGSEGFYVSASSATEEKIRTNRISETQFTFGEPGQQVNIDFKKDAVDVGLSFGGTERPVVSHGMASIFDPADSLTLKYIRQSLEVPDAQILSFVGGSGTDLGGVPLRGMSLMYSVTTPQETKPAGWIFSPWLTSPDVIAENEVKSGGPYIAYYKSDGNGKSEFLSSVPLKNLLVKMDANQKLVVSLDGRYMLDNGDNRFALVSDIWRKQGVPEEVISYYETLFIPAVSAEEWASDKETGQVKPENMFPLVGAINHKNRYTLDLGFGTMRLAVAQDKDLAQIASHRDLRGIVGLDLDNNLELRKRLLTIRSNFAKLDEFKGKKDFKDLTLIIEGGVVTLAVLKVKDELRKYKVDREGNIAQLKKEEEPPLLPELYVDGPFIKKADTGETIVFKGVSIFLNDEGRSKTGKSISKYVTWNVEENEKLGIKSNIVRLSFYSKDVDDETSLNDFVTAVDQLAQRGIYVVLTPHNDSRDPNSNNRFLPNEQDKQIMVKLAEKLRDRTNVIYGLWNEPAATNWSVWNNIIQDIYNRMVPVFDQKTNKPILMVPGIEWSRDFRGARIPLPPNSYIIDVHNYGYQSAQLTIDISDIIKWWEIMVGQVPILITEMGDVAPPGPQSSQDLEVIKKTFEVIHKYPPGQIGYLNWRGEDGREGLREFGIITERGKLNLEERQNFSTQTDFTN